MPKFKQHDIVTICTDTLECTEAEKFLSSLIDIELQVVEVTDEYKDITVPTYKCKYVESDKIVMRDNAYFPFVDADLQILSN